MNRQSILLYLLLSFCFGKLFVCAVNGEETGLNPKHFPDSKYRLIGPYAGGRVSRVTGIPGNPLIYYVATASGGVWKSTNGGQSFFPIFDSQPVSSIGCIAVAKSDPNVIYVGTGEANIRGNVAAGNGIYLSTDAGKTWKHVWNQIGHIGKIVVHPERSNTAYAAVLGHAFGPNRERGLYRTTDGGKSWQKILYYDENTGAIDVVIDPHNPRILLASLWQTKRTPWNLTDGGPGSGLYKSIDSGDHWIKLNRSSKTPIQPNKENSSKENTGEEIGGEGLPAGIYGRIGLAIAPSDSQVYYALIEADKGGLYRSNDAGKHWQLMTMDRSLLQRLWYFGTLTIDPTSAEIIYAPQVRAMKSIDGGAHFKPMTGFHHGDHHDLWIDPHNSQRMIMGHDAGVEISTDGGKNWFLPALPITQFYHVACDNHFPYHVMGCMQDLSSTHGPSRSVFSRGILMSNWQKIGGGEAGFAVPDPFDSRLIYAGEYGGAITRFNRFTGQMSFINAYPFNPSGYGGEDLKYRFQWTAPILVSRHSKDTIYHASNVLFRSKTGGSKWSICSPDLTRNDRRKQKWSGGPITGDNTGVEIYGTIFSIAESPLNANILWAGSDDGLVHVSKDNCKSWENVTANIPDLPDWGTVVCLEPSHVHEGTAYLVVDAHRLDDYRPYLWKTNDFGKSWKSLTQGLDRGDYLHVVREDPTNKNILYLGSESHISISIDGGKTWQKWQQNMPSVAIHDLVVHQNDLVVATHGRSLWILDHLTSLRGYAEIANRKSPHLFPISPTYRWNYISGNNMDASRGAAANPIDGAIIEYYLPRDFSKDRKLSTKKSAEDLTITIRNAQGEKVVVFHEQKKKSTDKKEGMGDSQKEEGEKIEEEISQEEHSVEGSLNDTEDEEEGESAFHGQSHKKTLSTNLGINRLVWDLRHEGAKIIPGAKVDSGDPGSGPKVAPGLYIVELTLGKQSWKQTLEIRLDPKLILADQVTAKLGMPRVADEPTIREFEKQLKNPKSGMTIQPMNLDLFRERTVLNRADLLDQEKTALQIRDDISKLSKIVISIRSLEQQLSSHQKLLAKEPKAKEFLRLSKAFQKKLDTLEQQLHNPKAQVVYDILAQKGGAKLYSQFTYVLELVSEGDNAPGIAMKEQIAVLERELKNYQHKWTELIQKELKILNENAEKNRFPILWYADK